MKFKGLHRQTYLKGSSKNLQLYIDLIYSKTINYNRIDINPMKLDVEQRYLIAESLAFELT
jgi:hypothetical protein